MPEANPPLVFLTVARPSLSNDYAFQELLSEEFGVPITAIHEALVPGSVRPLELDEYCSDLQAIFEALTQFEDFDAKRLPQLVQEDHARVIIIMEDDRCHPEVLVALALLVAGYAHTLPDVLSIHSEDECAPYNWQIINHFRPDCMLSDDAMTKSSAIEVPQ